MKKLRFEYEMKLTFSSPVTNHHFQLRCIPATGPRQQIVDVQMSVDPEVKLNHLIDSFGSVVATGYIAEPHDSFGYKVSGIAFVDNSNTTPECNKPLYRFDSVLTQPGPCLNRLIEICRTRVGLLPENASPVDIACEIMDEVYRAFVYTPGATTIKTTAEEALAQGTGVCQDYAHVMLAVCRHMGLTARYIAGMLGGEGASHAWVEIYYEDRWIGLDPTHNRLIDDSYITIAHGRDYRDCMLDIGVFSGVDVTQSLWVKVSVHE